MRDELHYAVNRLINAYSAVGTTAPLLRERVERLDELRKQGDVKGIVSVTEEIVELCSATSGSLRGIASEAKTVKDEALGGLID